MLTDERRREIFIRVDKYIRSGGESPFIAREHGQLHVVAEKIHVPVEQLREHYAMLDRELPPVGEL